MKNFEVHPNTDPKLKPVITALYDAIYNDTQKVTVLPDFDSVTDLGISDAPPVVNARRLQAVRDGRLYSLAIFFFHFAAKNWLAVRDESIGENLLQVQLDYFLEDYSGNYLLWHDGIVSITQGISDDEMREFVKEHAANLFQSGKEGDFIQLGWIKNEGFSVSDSSFRELLSSLLLYSLLRGERKDLYRQEFDTSSVGKFLLVNITWNSNDWKAPSTDKSGHAWVAKGNTPHESWNFDFDNPRNTADYVFGFTQFNKPPRVEGNDNLIVFYSKNNIVGFYGRAEVLPEHQYLNDRESYNLIAKRELCVLLPNKITNVKEKGYLEDKQKVGQIGFNYINKRSTINKILKEAIKLNPEQTTQLNALMEWINTQAIPNLIKKYKKHVQETGNENEIYKWQLVQKNLGRPNTDAADFVKEITSLNFKNLVYHSGIAVLHALVKTDAERLRGLFKVLFDEGRPLQDRLNYFGSETLKFYREQETTLQHHQDERSMATYLTFFNPNKYTLFKDSFYQKYCKLLGVAPVARGQKYTHYLDLVNELTTRYINGDSELLQLKKSFIPDGAFQDSNNLLLAQDILYQTLDIISDSGDVEIPVKSNDNMSSLNTIFYGPPGTGKTYHTIEAAIGIVNPDYDLAGKSRKDVKSEYGRLQKEGLIEFVTFHQSMTYEDFVEGIKPVEPKPDDPFLKYEVKPGILRRLVARALFTPSAESTGFSLPEDEYARATFYKISLGNTANPDDDQIFQYCIDNGYIGLGWGGANDFTGRSEEEIQAMVPAQLQKFEAQEVNIFIHYLKEGDYVVVSYGNLAFRAIGRVTGEYEFKKVPGLGVNQFRKVQWLLKDQNVPVEELYYKNFSQQTLYRLNKGQIKREFFVKSSSGATSPALSKRNYVLIIDEINRGNISQIFGEMITLIEDDKRKGREEELQVLLPYSGDLFSVPDNIYIIGTMNTADRSVEALDTALRRRFSFVEMQANAEHPEIKTEVLIAGETFSFVEVLATINKRLEKLIGRDHQIGHSYFIEKNGWNWEDYFFAFRNKIIPLLQEYFYGDYGKMALVIGKGFVDIDASKSNSSDSKFFASSEHEALDSFLERQVWRLQKIETEEQFSRALHLLLNK